ncbi:MAG: hypothetical protein QOE70_3232 [Chthoniobacter sp.]|jgi:hypothetical protein|nr:hypothetical protein [Chthoniobacter sp.]
MTTPTHSRRHFLRGAGALLALPFLDSLNRVSAYAAAAAGAGQPPLRLGIFTVTGGTVVESWKMPQAGPLLKLPSILRPLEFCKDDLLLVTGLANNGKTNGLNGHESCAFTHLTSAEEVRREGGKPVATISVDQAVAEVAGKETLFPSLEFGLSNQETIYSFRRDGTHVPYEADPRLVFERMFRGRKPVVPNWSRRAASLAATTQQSAHGDSYDRSVIDLVLDNAKSLQRRLGRADQQKLDEYLTAVRSVEERIELVEARRRLDLLDEQIPGPSKLAINELLTDEKSRYLWRNTEAVRRDPERHRDYIALMADLMVLAFQTDTTRVATFAAGSDEAMFPGVVTVGYERHCHTLEHQGNSFRVEDADPISREACRQIHTWYTTLFAEMVRKMKAIDEGGSSLLDNTMLLYTSYMADGGHGRADYPALLVGKARGTLKTGRQLDFPRKTPVANLYIELMNRMGVASERFGDSHTASGAAFDGKLPGLI